MIESLSGLLNTIIAVALGVIGWMIKKLTDRLDSDEKRLTKIEVELAAQSERDTAVEKRMGGLETNIKEINQKLDRMMEMLMKR